jgi:RNA-binding protein Nova
MDTNGGGRPTGADHVGGGLNNPFVLPLATGGALNLKFNMDPSRHPTDPALMGQYLGHIGSCLRSCGYSDMASEEIGQALRCLATHGIIVINLTSPTVASSSASVAVRHGGHPGGAAAAQHLQQPMAQPPPPFLRGQVVAFQQQEQQPPPAAAGGSFILNNPNSYSRYWNGGSGGGDPMQEAFGSRQARPMSPVNQGNSPRGHQSFGTPSNQNSFGLGPTTGSSAILQQQQQQEEQAEIEVNENIIGAVIGPSGRSIVDIQQHSGAKIKISKKGTFSPGTRNRIVTITGSHESIATAKGMIEHKILEEENKRERNTSY